jgi:hypothetical protein
VVILEVFGLGRPSIFSREYKRRMRVRRRRVSIAVVVIIAILGLVSLGGFQSHWFDKGINFIKANRSNGKSLLTGKTNEKGIDSNTDNNKGSSQPDNNATQKPVEDATKNIPPAEKYHQVTLYEGKIINVIYEEGSEGKKLKGIKDELQLYNNLSPAGKSLVVWESTSQNMYLIDSEGGVKDITKPFYVTRNTNTSYKKEDQLKRRPTFVWCATPKFISEDAVAYVSDLPTLSEYIQYIWVYEASKNEHRQIYSKGSKSVVFKDFVDGKLNAEADGAAISVLPDGKVENK